MATQQEHFEIIYDGPALDNHEMDIRDLAPALLAISDVLEEANKIINGDKTRVQVNVKGTFKSGSFAIDLSVVHASLPGFTNMFVSDGVNAASNLLQIVGFLIPGGSLFGFIQFLLWLQNRPIKKVDTEGAVSIVQVEDESIQVNPFVIALFSNVKIRTNIQKVIVEPLSREGIDSFRIKNGNEEIIEVNDEKKEYFKLSEIPDELLKDQDREVFLKIVTISFSAGHKWRFTDGNVEFYATITDDNFIKSVQESRDGFYKDDLLKVKLRERQWISDTGIKSDYEIVEVIEHRSSAKQISIPFDDE